MFKRNNYPWIQICNTNYIKFFVIIDIFITHFPAHSAVQNTSYANKKWHPFISLGAGILATNDFGQSAYFPPQDSITDNSYVYSTNPITKVVFLVDGFLGVEWNFAENWELQIGIDYNQTINHLTTQGSLIQGTETEAINYGYEYRNLTTQLLLESKILYRAGGIYYPFLLGGIGMAFNHAFHYNTSAPYGLEMQREYQPHTQTTLSWAAGFGLDIDVVPHFRIGATYRFVSLGAVKLGNACVNGVNVLGTLSQSNFYSNEVFGQMTFLF